MHQVPENYCKDCKHFVTGPAGQLAACNIRAELTREPVMGEYRWIGLLDCATRRLGQRRVSCPDYKEAE